MPQASRTTCPVTIKRRVMVIDYGEGTPATLSESSLSHCWLWGREDTEGTYLWEYVTSAQAWAMAEEAAEHDAYRMVFLDTTERMANGRVVQPAHGGWVELAF